MAEPEATAWMAGIRSETQFLCGGTVIHKRFVLSAAHCIDEQGILFVMLGAYNLSRPDVEYRVSHAEIHREYSRETLQNDIGLLKLPVDIVFTEHIYPICIDLDPTIKREVENAVTFDAYGWGNEPTANNLNFNSILQRVTLNHYHRNFCNFVAFKALTPYQICVGSLNSDTCFGDSGGPLIKVVNYNGTQRLTQLGMVSYGLTSCQGLGIYTDITSYAEWIKKKIKAQFNEYSSKTSRTARNVNPFFGSPQTELDNLDQNSPTAIVIPVSFIPPPETAVFGAENFGKVRLLFEPCGTSLSKRIMSGNNAEPEAATWMAGVLLNTEFICGGTVIHRRYVLTAANCIAEPGNLSVKLGAYDIRRPTMMFSVSKKIIHEEFVRGKHIHDIALLQLSRNIHFNWHVYPICIILNPEVKSKVENAYTFDAYGWGKTADRRLSNLLQEVTLDHFNRRECDQFLRVPLQSSEICAGASVGDTCFGDSGGPLTKNVFVNGIQRQTQFGITTFGLENCSGIGLYTDITSYAHWIVQKVRGLRATRWYNV